MAFTFSDHVSRVFSTAVDLNHLIHPFTDADQDEEPPSVANRLGAAALLVLSVATLGTLTGFYFYRAHRKVVHLEKREGQDKVIAHLYLKKKEENTEPYRSISKAEKEKMDLAQARQKLLKGQTVCHEESLGNLNDHEKAVLKAAVALGAGKAAKALEQVELLKNEKSLTPEEKREFLSIALKGDQVSVVLDLLEAFADEATTVKEDGPEVDKVGKFLLFEDFPWEEITNKKIFEALWNKVDKTRLTTEAQKAISRLVFKNRWVEHIASIVKTKNLVFRTDDIKDEKVFDALLSSLLNLKEELHAGLIYVLLSILVENGWTKKLETNWNALSFGDFDIPWDKVEDKELFKVLWEKEKAATSRLSYEHKNAILRFVVKNDWVDKIDEIWTALGSVVIPWDEVKTEKMFNEIWKGLPEDKKSLCNPNKKGLFAAVVRNNLVERVYEIWQEIGEVDIPWREIRSPEMHKELRSKIEGDNKVDWIEGILLHARSVEIIKDYQEKEGKTALIFGNGKTALHTCTDPKIAEYLISEEGGGLHANVQDKDEKYPTPLYTTPSAVQKVLLEHGADPRIKHPEGYNLLHVCKDPEIIKLVLEKDLYVIDALDKDGRTPLHLCDDPEIMKLFIEYGADTNIKDKNGNTPFGDLTNPRILKMLAKAKVKKGLAFEGSTLLHLTQDVELAKRLLAHGADIEAKNKNGSTPLLSSFSNDVKKLLIEKGANVNAQDKDGRTPLLDLCQYCTHEHENEYEVIRLLLEKGANPNVRLKESKNSPLHWALRPDLVNLLIEKGANIEAVNEEGNTPLFEAKGAKCGVAQQLIEKGADITKKNKNGETLLHRLIDEVDIAETLVKEHHMDVNARDNNGDTPLIASLAYTNHYSLPMANKLIELGAEVHNANNQGKNILHFCTFFDKDIGPWKDFIKLLVETKRLNPNLADNIGNTVLHRVIDVEATQTLIDNGANPRLTNNKGQSPLLTSGLNREALADYFIGKGLDPTQTDNEGKTALHLCNKNHASYWVGKGVDVNAQDLEGKTALHFCTAKWQAVDLIKLGANPELRDNDGNLPPLVAVHPEWFTQEKER